MSDRPTLAAARAAIAPLYRAPEPERLAALVPAATLTPAERRHAGRGGAHRGRRQALPRGLCRGDRGARGPLFRRAVRDNPGVSVKLSALHPRYEFAKRERVMERAGRAHAGAGLMARGANMGFNIDAEEADRLDLSARCHRGGARRPTARRLGRLRRGGAGLWASAPATSSTGSRRWPSRLDRRLMVRLVKGAYWDARSSARRCWASTAFRCSPARPRPTSATSPMRGLLSKRHRIYPQFATHNAHRSPPCCTSPKRWACDKDEFEFQRLHGMGERLHQILAQHGTRTRIYAPVGRPFRPPRLSRAPPARERRQRLVRQHDRRPRRAGGRRGARSVRAGGEQAVLPGAQPGMLFAPSRRNSRGLDITDPQAELAALDAERGRFAGRSAGRPASQVARSDEGEHFAIASPATGDPVGEAIGRRAGDHRCRDRHERSMRRRLGGAAGRGARAAAAPGGRPLRGECRRVLRAVRARGGQDAGRRCRRSSRSG
jgi:RHH-type proline utilization regulon transcriptional repressor/proline dehydrogenase/delta 1-pyrroline-5-carboxylate dehydrogenase